MAAGAFSAYRIYNAITTLNDIYSAFLAGVFFNDGSVSYSFSGTIDQDRAFLGIALGVWSPADDVAALDTFVKRVNDRRVGDALDAFLDFGERLGEYGSFRGQFGVRGAGFGARAWGLAWFRTDPNGVTAGVKGFVGF